MDDPTLTKDDRVRRIEVQVTRLGLGLAHRLGEGVGGALFDRLIQALAVRHPRAFAALADLPEARLLIDPEDAPAALMLRVGPRVALRVCGRDEEAEATVRSRCACLLDLFEGRIDGDALFFRRELTIEGDTALILALRNTLDGEDIDLLADAATVAPPLRHALPVARRAAGHALDLLDGVHRGVHRALPPPLERGLTALEHRVAGRFRGV